MQAAKRRPQRRKNSRRAIARTLPKQSLLPELCTVTKDENGREEAGSNRAPSRIDLRDRCKSDVANSDMLCGWIGGRARPASVNESGLLNGVRYERDCHIRRYRARARIVRRRIT